MKPTTTAAKDLIIASDDYDFAMALVVSLQSAHVRITVEQLPLAAIVGAMAPSPDAAIIEMRGGETVLDLHALFEGWSRTRIVFVAREMPLRATLARIIHQNGGVILSKAMTPTAIAATLGAMLASKEPAQA